MYRCVLGKDSLRLFPIWTKQFITVVVVQPDERLANRTPKRCSVLVQLYRCRRVPGSYERTNLKNELFQFDFLLDNVLKVQRY